MYYVVSLQQPLVKVFRQVPGPLASFVPNNVVFYKGCHRFPSFAHAHHPDAKSLSTLGTLGGDVFVRSYFLFSPRRPFSSWEVFKLLIGLPPPLQLPILPSSIPVPTCPNRRVPPSRRQAWFWHR